MTRRDHEAREIARLAAGLKKADESLGLWSRIEAALASESVARQRRPVRRAALLGGALAATLLAAVLLPGLLVRPDRLASPFLEETEFSSLAREEGRITDELAHIEPMFRRKVEIDGWEGTRIRSEIDYLDANIESCRSLSRRNSMNRSVRQALIRSYRLKLETMRQFVSR